jgi:glycosyltransferase involved in cell wall biosynthesis
VDLTPFDNLPPRKLLETEFPELVGKFVLLFFGRLHAKKGLDLLAEALGRIAPAHPEIHLIIAGNDDGAFSPFRERITELGLNQRVTYFGHVSGERARQVWSAADAFVLPSYSEGFSMAILEAMACRLPCLFTTACYFPEAAAANAAVIAAPSSTAVTEGLRGLLERTTEERRQLGENARCLVEARYTWDRQAENLAAVYDWLCGGGSVPEVIIR